MIIIVGAKVGTPDGISEGAKVGTLVGMFDGAKLGLLDGAEVGTLDGIFDGIKVGTLDGVLDGAKVGTFIGVSDGATLGTLVGIYDGIKLGLLEDAEAITEKGILDGDTDVGTCTGVAVRVGKLIAVTRYKALPRASPQFSPLKHGFVAQLQAGLLHFVHLPH